MLLQDEAEMLEDLEQGDVAQTIKTFFEKSVKIKPSKSSDLTLQEVLNFNFYKNIYLTICKSAFYFQVDIFLEHLSKLTKEDEQMNHFKYILKR